MIMIYYTKEPRKTWRSHTFYLVLIDFCSCLVYRRYKTPWIVKTVFGKNSSGRVPYDTGKFLKISCSSWLVSILNNERGMKTVYSVTQTSIMYEYYTH